MTHEHQSSFWTRFAWMIVIWGASVLTVGLLAGIIRLWLVG